MALSARFSLLNSDFSDFLYAAIDNEQNGMPLSVVSGLTRLGLDPWEEAAQLASLPKALAVEALALIIARLPFDRPERSDHIAISRRLVELLPEPQAAASPDRQQTGANGTKFVQTILLLGCLAIGVAILVGML
jgi:hypothetical protein